jgi:adenylate kinase family enzyme
MSSFPQRIAVCGTSGSGKSTTARRLSAITGHPYVELDALHWKPGWTASEPAEFREKVRDALDGPRWIVDGNYRIVRDITWGQADELLWLDYSLPRVMKQLTQRTFSRRMKNELLWGTNREQLRMFFLSKESLYLWVLQTHWKHRREYPPQFAGYPQLHVTRVRSPRELETYIEHVAQIAGNSAGTA